VDATGSDASITMNDSGDANSTIKRRGSAAAAVPPVSDQTTAQSTPSQDLSSKLWQPSCMMMYSPLRRQFFLQDLGWLLVRPIAMKLFRMWRRDNLPVVFASRTFLSPEVEERFKGGPENDTRRLVLDVQGVAVVGW